MLPCPDPDASECFGEHSSDTPAAKARKISLVKRKTQRKRECFLTGKECSPVSLADKVIELQRTDVHTTFSYFYAP